MNESVNKFLGFENENFKKSLSLVEFYEIAEELIVALQYFALKQKEEDLYVRLTTSAKRKSKCSQNMAN